MLRRQGDFVKILFDLFDLLAQLLFKLAVGGKSLS